MQDETQKTQQTVTHIVAISRNRVIGKDGDLPWRIPADLKFFKEKTTGHPIIMGRKTYASIKRALPGRLNIVITRQSDFSAENVLIATSIEAALKMAAQHAEQWGHEVFIIGGGEIYRQSLPYTRRIYLTEVDASIEGDTFYPELGEQNFSRTPLMHGSDPINFTMWLLERVS